MRPDGIAIAPTAAAFFSAELWDAPPNQEAQGDIYRGNHGVYSGASSIGTAASSSTNCDNWRSTSGTAFAGRSGFSVPDEFTSFDTAATCDATFRRILCLEE